MAENDNESKREAYREALKNSNRWISVLNDGETYTGLQGAWIAQTPENFDEDNSNLEEQIRAEDRIDLWGLVTWAIDQGCLDPDEPEDDEIA